jgi:acetyl esterase/lipase
MPFRPILLLAFLGGAMLAGDAGAIPKPLVLKNCENLHDLRYLPDWRYTGARGPRGDWEMTLNLHIPTQGTAPRPLVMFVHGGAYSAGHKDEGYPAGLLQVLVDAGFAVGSMNYILVEKGIFPQVWWDFEEAARYLRVHARKHGLDPNAFGAVGISAGGWLIATAGHADGRIFTRGMNSYATLTGKDPIDPRARPGEESFLRPTLAPATAYPGVSGRWQALAYDFDQCRAHANGFTPALLGFVGSGNIGMPKDLAAAGVEWTPAVLTHPFFATREVHAPKLVTAGHEGERSMARTLDGTGEVQLADVIRDWFRLTLAGAQARTPVPEIWPADRLVEGPVEVSMVTTDPAVAVRYTTDGSEPGANAQVYAKPFIVPPGTTVRAVAELKGRRPSRTVAATFVDAGPRIRISTPESRELPPAKTGEPYSVPFTANRPGARWSIQGDLRPFVPDKAKSLYYPNGMIMDGSGRWSGIPTTPGTFWVQVWVNDGPGRPATHRDYRWTVTGEPKGPQRPADALTADLNQPLATTGPWRDDMLALLRERMQEAGVRLVVQENSDKSVILLAPGPLLEPARAVLTRLRQERPKDIPRTLGDP